MIVYQCQPPPRVHDFDSPLKSTAPSRGKSPTFISETCPAEVLFHFWKRLEALAIPYPLVINSADKGTLSKSFHERNRIGIFIPEAIDYLTR